MSAATAAAGSKQADLAKSLALTVVADLKETLTASSTAMADNFAEVVTRLGAMEARLEVIETACSGAKKVTKTAAKGSAAAAKKATGGKKAVADDPREKVKNSMLYFRWAWAHDPEFHETYVTDDIREALDADANLLKKKDPVERMLAEGTSVWKLFLTEEQKKEVRTLFNEWQAQREKEDMEPQLDENGEDVAAEAE